MNYEIWSTYPPPFGGVTIHTYRLFNYLKENGKFKVIFRTYKKNNINNPPIENVLNWNYLNTIFILYKNRKSSLFHFHSQNLMFWSFISLLPFKINYFITIHNLDIYLIKNYLRLKITRLYLNKSQKILINDKRLHDYIISKFNLNVNKFVKIEAYIPPNKLEYSTLENKIHAFRDKVELLISGNAFKLMFDKNKQDLYGVDISIELIYRLRSNGYNVGLIFVIPIIEDFNYFNYLNNKINDYKINDYILFIRSGLKNAFQIWSISDIFIRPTSTDIEGISIKEAMFFGVKCVASNVCERPEGTFLFRNRDFDDFYNKVCEAFVSDKKVKYEHINTVEVIEKLIINYMSIDKDK